MVHPLKFASRAALFALVAAAAARADTITLSLSAPTASYAGGTETLTYVATITASSMNAADVYLNGDSLNVQLPLAADDDDFYLNVPPYLDVGDSFTGDLFTVTVPYGTAWESYPGSFVLLGGSDGDTYDTLATADFSVPVSVTPEPSSLALLASGTLAMGYMVRRRRAITRA